MLRLISPRPLHRANRYVPELPTTRSQSNYAATATSTEKSIDLESANLIYKPQPRNKTSVRMLILGAPVSPILF